MRTALYFDNPDEFCDFVRRQGENASPETGDLFEFRRVVHPTRPGNSALILFNFKSKLIDRLFGETKKIKAECVNGNLSWTLDPPTAPLLDTHFAKTLVECVELIEWSDEVANQAGQGALFFWIEKSDLVADLISQSLQLGNDRIQYSPIQSVDGNNFTIVRIDQPSHYLIQKSLEEHAGIIQIYYQSAEDLYFPWGHMHPLRKWWQRSERKRSGEWVFFSEGSSYIHLKPIQWRDGYDLADLKLDFSQRQLYSQAPESPARFEVKMRLTQKAVDASPPELWLLNETGTQQLENTLQLTDEGSLRSWQIAVQKIDDQTGDWVFIRETRSNQPRTSSHHDFGGVAFARYRGINNLLLPIGYELHPPLRRDAYRHLFDLEPGFISLLIPENQIDPRVESDSFLIVKINERSFDVLSSYIDYIVERDAVKLTDLMDGSVFDFKHYLKAPKHPGLTSGDRSDEANQKKSVTKLGDINVQAGSQNTAEDESDTGSLMDRLQYDANELDESALGELETLELQLERELVTAGQSIDLWCDLLVCKNKLGKNADAVIATVEALWIANGTAREQSLLDSLKDLAQNSIDGDPFAITTEEHEWIRRSAVLCITLSEPDPDEIDLWISETTAFLREHDGGLRSKERWIAWGRILEKNQDERRETQLREKLRNRIAEDGLSLEETPSFLRSRIFLDRRIGQGGDTEVAVDTAIANLKALHATAKQFGSDRLKLASQAILARAYSNIGDVARAQNHLLEPTASKDHCALAWETMFQIEALKGLDQNRADKLIEKLPKHLKAASPDTVAAINELRQTYEERGDSDNPAAFLARQNRGRTYPRGPGTEQGELFTLSKKLEDAVTKGHEAEAVAVMRSMMSIKDTKEYDQNVKLPQFIETLVAGLERFKWGERGASLVTLYEEFTERVPGYLSATNNQFYGSILYSNLALGLLVLENVDKASEQIDMADKLIRDPHMSDLDFVDASAALIRTVEQLPLSYRRNVLDNLIEEFRRRFDHTSSSYLVNERLFTVLARLLDQMAEAASSKDRLSLQQFRSYQLQDEFLILQRIQSETFIKKP